jgi:hypothetical protein
MAADNRQIPKKKKKPRKLNAEEEVVITLGKSPKKKEDDEISIKLSKEDSEDHVVIDHDFNEDFDSELDEEFEDEEIEAFDEDEDDDVVVISIGKPPKKKVITQKVEPEYGEEEVEGEIQIGEPIEAEVVEEEGEEGELGTEEEEGKKGKKKKKEKDKKSQKKQIIAVIIAIIIIFSSIGIFFIFLQNQDPVARLNFDPTTAMAGELIVMDASDSEDDKGISRVEWDFDDEITYSEDSEDAPDGEFDKKTTHSYEESGDYTVKITVWDSDDKKATAQTHITITDLVVIVPEEKIDDSITYDVNGTVDVSNKDGLFTESTDFGSVEINSISINYEGYMDSSIKGTISQDDGFGVSHETLQRYNYQDLDIEGSVSGTIYFSGTPTPFDYPINDGSLTVTDNAYVDLNTYKTIFSKTDSLLSISAEGDLGVFSKDTLRTYSNLRAEPAVLKVEDLSSDRTFIIGQQQTKIIGEIAYTWEVEGATNINGYPALGINIDIDDGTKNDLGLVYFDMWMYIANDISFPIRTYVDARFLSDGTSTEIVYNSEIQEDGQESGFIRGNDDIPYGTCPQNTPDGHFHRRNPGFEFVNWDVTDYLPDTGSNSTDFDFTPQMAIVDAQTSSTDFKSYLTSNPGAYVIDGYYNETQTDPLWNLTFGELGDDSGYFVVVDATGSIIDENIIEISQLRNSTDDFNSVLSYSASQMVFKEDDVASDAFDSNGVMYYSPEEYNYGSQANIIYPTLSLTVSLAIERAEYGYYLTKEDGTFSAGVDAINGQMIYTWVHEGDDVMSIIVGP